MPTKTKSRTLKTRARPVAYGSKALGVVHRMMKDAHDVGAVDKLTMREFDEMCLVGIQSMTAAEIQKLRSAHNVSQAVFARILNVSKDLVSQWERGEKRPSGPSLKLLTLVKTKGLDAVI
jgi:putative transcriptional regulator